MKNKSVFIGILIVVVIGAIVAVAMIVGKNKNSNSKTVSVANTNTTSSTNSVPQNKTTENKTTENKTQGTSKSEQKGTAGSNMPLKDNQEEARRQVEIAMKNLIKESYGDEVVDSKINVTKIYTATEEQQNEMLKQMNLGQDEVAFEVNYELKIADGVKDAIKFTAGTGDYNEQTRWVTNKFNLGVLRPDGNGYKITDFGTGW